MKQDIDFILDGWEYKPGMVQARLVQARGRQVIQMRVDLGVLQLESQGRPDGTHPHGQDTYFEHLQEQARMATRGKSSFTLSEEQCQEADREFVQFYHRRICWLALRDYPRAIQDADHTLAFMDFVKKYSPSEEYTQAHEQYRGFVLFQRTQAAAAWQVEQNKPERAVDEVRNGLEQIKTFFTSYDMEEQLEEDGMVQHLRSIEKSLREQYDIGETLQEQLDRAIAEEDYERAAKLRDQLKRGKETAAILIGLLIMNDSTPAYSDTTTQASTTHTPRGKSPWRLAAPLALFVLIIGGIAWLVQNVPSWRSPKPAAEVRQGPEAHIAFAHPTNMDKGVIPAVWYLHNPAQAREFEKGDKGSYYFPFRVHPDRAPEIGLTQQSCDCAKLHVALLSETDWAKFGKAMFANPSAELAEDPAWSWQEMQKSADRGIPLTSGGFALLRMSWDNRRSPGEQLNLKATVWVKQGAQRQEFAISVPAVATNALRFKYERSNVGQIGPGGNGKAEFVLWSPTRDQAVLKLHGSPSSLLNVNVTALDEKERANLEKKLLEEKVETHVRSAWRVNVIVYEHKDDQWLDQGHFLKTINVGLEGDVEDNQSLIITGLVRSEVQIGGTEDQGRVNLGSFPTDVERRKDVLITTDANVEFEQPPSWRPAAVQVKLTENVKQKAVNRRSWTLQVVVPPNQLFGTIPDDNAVILRIKSTPPRQIRIPLMGHAVQR